MYRIASAQKLCFWTGTNYKCVVCSFDLRMDNEIIGLEAAHIKWKQFSGPCEVQNGLSLCALHHKAFDKGAIAIGADHTIAISPAVNGGDWAKRLFFDFAGKTIELPRDKQMQPATSFLQWRCSEVFQGWL